MDDSFDGFAICVDLDPEGYWVAYFEQFEEIQGFSLVDVEDALFELQFAWEEYKTSCLQHGEAIPVPYIIRDPSKLLKPDEEIFH